MNEMRWNNSDSVFECKKCGQSIPPTGRVIDHECSVIVTLAHDTFRELDSLRAQLAEEKRTSDRTFDGFLKMQAMVAERDARIERLEEALKVFFDEEFSSKADWLGLCGFRRAEVRCPGTDGHNSGAGTPRPTPHSEFCPYTRARAALAKGSE